MQIKDHDISPAPERHASLTHELYQWAFQATDASSHFWSPMLKSMSRAQFEYATFLARQGQAILQWGHEVAAARSPTSVVEANMELTRTLSRQYSEFLPRMTEAFLHQAQALPELTPKPQEHPHDRIEIQNLADKRRAAPASGSRPAA